MLLPKQVLNFGKKIAAVEPSRYVINSILIDPQENGEMRAVATNGKMLSILSWNPENLESKEQGQRFEDFPKIKGIDDNLKPLDRKVIINSKDLEEVSKISKCKTPRPLLNDFVVLSVNGGDQVQFGMSNGRGSKVLNVVETDGNYPHYDDFIPHDPVKASIRLSIPLLQDMLKSMSDSGFDTVDFNLLEKKDHEEKPAILQAGHKDTEPNGLAYKGIVMPINRT